jgi:hypothetical protein
MLLMNLQNRKNIAIFCSFISPEIEERRMTHLQETLINRPYGTGRVFFLSSRYFVPGYPRFDPSGINA